MPTTVLDVITAINRVAPPEWAAPCDQYYQYLGDVGWRVGRVLVALDVTEEVLDEAVALKAKLIVAHHPLFVEPLTFISPEGSSRVIWRAVRKSIAIYVAHTNLDVAPEVGTADALADALGLREKKVILPSEQESVKIVTFVPEEHVERVVDALAMIGAGRIGLYDRCAFLSPGTGTFEPAEGARPFIGEPGKREEVREVRVEMVCPRRKLDVALMMLRLSHPYEEPAYDVCPVEQTATGRGYGRLGDLPRETTLGAFARRVARRLETRVRVVGDPTDQVQRVAVIPGSGGKHLMDAMANVVVTGDVKHHEALAARAAGVNVIDAGHYASERPVVARLAEYLRGQLGTEVEVLESRVNTDPLPIGSVAVDAHEEQVTAALSLRPREIGDILDGAIQLYRRNFGTFLGVVAVTRVPVALISIAVAAVGASTGLLPGQPGQTRTEIGNEGIAAILAIAGVGIVTNALVWLASVLSAGALTWLVSQRYMGRTGTIGDAYSYVMLRLWPLLATTFVVGLVVGLGTMACLVPGIILGIMYLFHVPVVMIEGLSTSRAMNRSSWLIQNDGWRVFACALLLGLLAVALPAAVLQVPVGILVGMFGERLGRPPASAAIQQVAAQLGPIVFAPVWMCGVVLLYYDERIRKEGYDLAVMAYELGHGPPPDGPVGHATPPAPGSQTNLPPPIPPASPPGDAGAGA